RQDGEAVSAFGFVHQGVDTLVPVIAGAAGEELDDELAVARRAEAEPALEEFVAQGGAVGQIAVVPDGKRAKGAFDNEGLGIEEFGRTGGRVAGVADCYVAIEWTELFFGEDLGNKTHFFVEIDSAPISDCDAGALLAAML
ncbi:MAG: hypothetical protein RI985_2206, partial [Chloroflexota bacterium]